MIDIQKVLRRRIPSAARLTYNPIFKGFVNFFDLVPKRMYQEFEKMPPNHMRIRVGLGPSIVKGIVANQALYLTVGKDFWMHSFQGGLCRFDSTILDIGCGCGRYAHHLRDYRFKSETFTGKYIGIDIDDEMLKWCRQNFDEERFEFHRSTQASKVYGGSDRTGSYYALPVNDDSVDFVFSTSLFTHLLEEDLANYCREAYRVLKKGSFIAMYCFCMDYLPPTYGGRHTFTYRIGNAHVESLSQPEAAVAYDKSFLFGVARAAGFQTVELVSGPEDLQPMLLCRK
jgi:ubiquinone/menaquinone biosynthesis C-methylase UbiE